MTRAYKVAVAIVAGVLGAVFFLVGDILDDRDEDRRDP